MNKKMSIGILFIIFLLLSQPTISIYNLRGSEGASFGQKAYLLKASKSIWNRKDDLKLATEKIVENFPIKKLSVSLISEFEYRIFNRSNNVIVGEDGFLSDKVVVEQLLELDKMQENDFKEPIRRLKNIKEYLENRGQNFLVVIVPLKPTIYKEKFPGPVSERQDIGLFKFQGEMQKNDIQFVDLHNTLFKARNKHVIYHKTDVHWNNVGSAIAVKEIINYLSMAKFEKELYSEEYTTSSMKLTGGESTSMALLKPISETYIKWNAKPSYYIETEVNESGDSLEKFFGTDPNKAILPKTLMFGNSYMNYYRDAGLQNYFKEFDQVLDYSSFKNFTKIVSAKYELVVLNIYESQILFHMIEGDNYNYWPNDLLD